MRNILKPILIFVFLLPIFGLAKSAELESEGIEGGDFELTIYGDLSQIETSSSQSDDKSSYNSGNFGLSIGYFLTKSIELGTGVFVYLSGDSSSETTSYTSRSFIKLHLILNNPTIVPYLSAFYDSGKTKTKTESRNDTSESETSITGWGYGMGIKFFISENTSFAPELSYSTLSLEDKDSDFEYDQTKVSLFMTLNTYF